MVGSAGPDVPGGQYNMAITPRQPGSAFKIFTYTAAVESQKFTMGSWVLDQPINVRVPDGSTYTPHNYDGSYHGWQPLPFALGNSFNIPAVKVELGTGTDQVVDVARRMGLTSLNQPARSYQPSLTLGGYEVPLIEMAAGAQCQWHRRRGAHLSRLHDRGAQRPAGQLVCRSGRPASAERQRLCRLPSAWHGAGRTVPATATTLLAMQEALWRRRPRLGLRAFARRSRP